MTPASITPSADLDQVRTVVELLIEPGAVFEMRILIGKKRTVSGYYENKPESRASFLRDVETWSSQRLRKDQPDSLYITLNRIDPLLLARSPHHCTDRAELTTSDTNVLHRRWLLVDVDAERPAGVSSTREQHVEALRVSGEIAAWLKREYGIQPVEADSGNGAHNLIRLDLPATEESRALLERVLKALAHRFDNDVVHVDLTTFNASRIDKLYGTVASKGESTEQQPHRQARLLSVPDDLTPAPLETLQQIAALAPEPPRAAAPAAARRLAAGRFSIEAFIAHHFPDAAAPVPYQGGRKWVLAQCPFNPDHPSDAAVFEKSDGTLGFHCFHNSCADYDWHALRDKLDPGGRNGRGPAGRAAAGGSRATGPAETTIHADDAAALEALLARVEETGDAHPVFAHVDLLARLPIAQYGAVKSRLKERLGKALNQNDLAAAVKEARQRGRRLIDGPEPDDAGSGLPEIVVNDRPLRAVSDAALAELTAANQPPTLFVRSGAIVRMGADEKNRPHIEAVTEHALRGRLTRIADFLVQTQEGGRHVAPPLDLVRDLLALGRWPFPPLAALVEVPTLRPDGSVIDQAGYDPITQIFYRPEPGLRLPAIPSRPTQEDAREAAVYLNKELFSDFPFTGLADRANAFGELLTPIAREAITGPTPLGVIDAPAPGTGKGLLAEIIAGIATGRSAAVMTAPKDEAEMRKEITTALSTGRTILSIDNVEGPLNSAVLAAAVTAAIWEDRLLGTNQMLHLPVRVSWLVNGNNVRLGGDIPRRCYRCRIDAKTPRPWERQPKQFRHPKLAEWVKENRGELLAALLTMCRAWYVAGCPEPNNPRLGSFEDWSRVIGGILHYAGVAQFLGNLDQLYDEMDDTTPQWTAFLAAWAHSFGEKPQTSREVVKAMDSDKALADALPDELSSATDKPGALPSRLGIALKKKIGVRYGPVERVAVRDNDGFLHDQDRVLLFLERPGTDKHDKVSSWKLTLAPVSLSSQETAGTFENLKANAGTCGDLSSPTHARDHQTLIAEANEPAEERTQGGGGPHGAGGENSPQVPASGTNPEKVPAACQGPEQAKFGEAAPESDADRLVAYGLAQCSRCQRILTQNHLTADDSGSDRCKDQADCRTAGALAAAARERARSQ